MNSLQSLIYTLFPRRISGWIIAIAVVGCIGFGMSGELIVQQPPSDFEAALFLDAPARVVVTHAKTSFAVDVLATVPKPIGDCRITGAINHARPGSVFATIHRVSEPFTLEPMIHKEILVTLPLDALPSLGTSRDMEMNIYCDAVLGGSRGQRVTVVRE